MRSYDERPLRTVSDRERVSALRAICSKLGLNYDHVCQVEVVGAIHTLQLEVELTTDGVATRLAEVRREASALAAERPRSGGW